MLHNKYFSYSLFLLQLFITIFLFLVSLFVNSINVLFFSVIFTTFVILFKTIKDKNFTCFLFFVSFCTLILGRLLLDFFNIYETIWYKGYVGDFFSIKIQMHLLIMINVFLIGFLLSFIFNNVKRKKKSNSLFFNKNTNIRKILLVLLIVSFLSLTYINIDAFIFILNNGYISYYKDYKSNFIIWKIGSLFIIYYAIYLSIFTKNDKYFKFVNILFILNGLLSLIKGTRREFVLTLFFLLWYYFQINRIFSFKILFKKFLIPGICLLILLPSVALIRDNIDVKISLKKIIYLFFYSQGTSIVVPGYQKKYESEIPKNGIAYLFPAQINLVNNVFHKEQNKNMTRRDQAIAGNYLAKYLSYKVLKNRYELGEGMGGSFLAEIYYAFNYFGVFIFSLLLGKFLSKFNDIIKYHGSLKYTLMILVIYEIFYMPRSGVFDFLQIIISLTFGFAIFVMLFADFLFYTKKSY